MPNRSKRTVRLLKEFKSLKQKKASMTPQQYLKELARLRADLNVQFEEPRISKAEAITLTRLLKSV